MKTCSTCRQSKSLADFNRNKRMNDGRHYSCRYCTNQQKRKSRNRNREVVAAKRRAYLKANPDKAARFAEARRLRPYGLTPSQLQDMRDTQGGCCAICSKPLEPGRKHGESIDHDHETGKVRALLCGDCNCMIGYARENADILLAGATYIVRFQAYVEVSP